MRCSGLIFFKYRIAKLLLVFFFTATSFSVFAQVSVTEKFENAPLIESLDLISKKYGVKIAYDNASVLGVTINASFKRASADVVLKKLLSNTDLEVIKINDVFIIKKIDPSRIALEKSQKVMGIVRDKASGESLPYATVKVEGKRVGTVTNTDGFFSIQENKGDSIRISVSYIGFEPIEMKVARLDINESPVVVELDRKSIVLSDVQVVKELPEFLSVGNRPGEFVWNSSKVDQIPTFSGIDVVAPLQMLPGIDATTESLSGLIIRHSPSDQNLFTYDGFTIYHIDHFFGAFTSFNSKAIKDIRVIRGGFDARWGERASSVVEITGKTGNEKSFLVDAGGDQLSADVAMEGPIGKKVTFVLAARRSFTDYYRSDLYYNLFESARSDLQLARLKVGAFSSDASLPKFFYYDANGKINFRPTSKDNISLSAYRGTDRLDYSQIEESPYVVEDSHWGNQGVGLRWSRQWGANFYHKLTIGTSDYSLFYNHSDSTLRKRQASSVRDTILKDYKIDNKLSDISFNLYGQLKLGKNNTVEGGFSGNIVDINSFESYIQAANGAMSIDTTKINDSYSETLTGWLQNTLSYGRIEAFTLGLRVTHHNLTSKVYFEPRFQLVYRPTDNLSLKLSAGLYNQFVNRVVQTGSSYRNVWVASDGIKFPVVKSKHLVAGFTWKLLSGFLIDLEGYAKNTEGITYVQNVIKRTNTTRISLISKSYSIDSRIWGVDVLVKKKWRNIECWAAYSLSRAYNQSATLNGGDKYFALDDHLHEFKIAGAYTLSKWRFTFSWIYGSPKPWDELLLTSTLQLSPDYEKNSERLIPYHRLDAGITYTQEIANTEIQLGVKGFNLYNRENILSKPYSLSDTPVQDYQQGNPVIVYTENYGLGFTPTFFLNIKF
ncbi:TonB-dependent receptor [Tenuifilaceae bacterium CYCD]|nr:TonB-dependent receptor [Tenuifilaceae bacterium CYCD]